MSCVITWAQKKSASNLKKINEAVFLFFIFLNLDFDLEISHLRKKFSFSPQKCKLELCKSNGYKVLIYLSFLLKEAVF